MERNLIIMHGYVCSLKTTISTALARVEDLSLTYFETKQFSKQSEKDFQPKRYNDISDLCGWAFKRGYYNILLDGTFGKKEYREEIYDKAVSLGLEDVLILNSYCNNEQEVRMRIRQRRKNDSHCIKQWEERSYDDISEDLYKGRKPSIIGIDTGLYRIGYSHLNTSFAERVFHKLIDILQNRDFQDHSLRIMAMDLLASMNGSEEIGYGTIPAYLRRIADDMENLERKMPNL